MLYKRIIRHKSLEMFKKENRVDPDKTQVVFEITLSNLYVYTKNVQIFVNFLCVYVLNGETIECDKPKINCKQIENISNVYNDRSISF